MKHKAADSFWRDFKRLPKNYQKKAEKAFKLFSENQRHPSFETHPLRGTHNPKLYVGYLDDGYRFIFHYEHDAIVYRRIGKHEIEDEETRRRSKRKR